MPNPGVSTLATIRAAAADRADMPTPSTTTFVTTATWNGYINSSYQDLFELLVQKYGNDYYSAIDANGNGYQFTTNGTADKYVLPDGSSTYKMPDGTTAPSFFKLLGVDLQVAGNNSWITLKPFVMIERNTFAVPNMQAVRGRRTNLRYRLVSNLSGNTPTQYVWLKPLPMSGQILQVWYIPRLAALTADGDLVDALNGWEEYIVVDAARKAAIKEESFELADRLAADVALIVQRIESAAENRDAGSPQRVGDSRRSNGWGEDLDIDGDA